MRQDHSDKMGFGKPHMQRKTLYSAIFLVLFSGVTIYLAFRLPLGHYGKPGPGFFPLLMSIFIGLLALVLFFTTVRSNQPAEISDGEMPERKWKVFYLLGQLCVYAFLYRRLGYVISTWIFLVSLKPIIKTKWAPLLLVSLLVSTLFFVFFNLLLKVELPAGILRL
jgi:putative tricarboxylic transport membrane protein